MKTIVVLFGGPSSEYEVSCKSASEIIGHMDNEEYYIHKIGISKDGKWLYTEAKTEEIATGNWVKSNTNKEVSFVLNGKSSKLCTSDGEINIDCIFPVLHGKFGEDGCVQGLLDLLGKPYVGCGVAASAIGFDKALTKILVNELNIPQAKCLVVVEKNDIEKQIEDIRGYFNDEYPIYVKPSREGSSVGITKITSKAEIKAALELGFSCDKKLVVEKGIVGREIEVAVLGTTEPKASPVGEIMTDDFYSYDSKYGENSIKTTIVTDVEESILNNVRNAAVEIYKKLECKSLSRVDFFLLEDGSFVFNEINTMPGFTTISMYPKLMEAAGIKYSELITQLINDVIN